MAAFLGRKKAGRAIEQGSKLDAPLHDVLGEIKKPNVSDERPQESGRGLKVSGCTGDRYAR